MHNFFRERRDELELTQRQIADRLNLTTAAISAWECGEGFPTMDKWDEVAATYKVSVTRLMNEIKQLKTADAGAK